MAPPRATLQMSSDHPEGYDEFIESLTAFHESRGTALDLQARVNGKHIDLYKLWNIVAERGGYDLISQEKLAWRRVGQEFNLGATNAAAYAFALKTVYYKNLAAYEIKTLYNEEPPPPEILEKITAKGGDLRKRTLDNFKPPLIRESLANGQDSEGSGGEETVTPKAEKMDIDDPGSGGGRTTRGLRQAPPQRVLFQPDLSSSRQVRHSSGHLPSPTPTAAPPTTGYNYSASSNPGSINFSVANYEPRQPMPLTLRGVVTPSNNPSLFKEKQRLQREGRSSQHAKIVSHKGMIKPGAGFDGPNIYVRTLQGLRSGISEEQDYALHHLVKISHERGDKYRFDAFPNLAEALIDYALGVSSLFYDVCWEICYTEDQHEINVLDGINGTPDILQRIQCLKRIDTADEMESEELAHKLTKIHETGLTLRNLSLLEDNAIYLSELPQLRDFLSIALNLPKSPIVTELKHYALEIAEQVTRYWIMNVEDPLYRSLLDQVDEGLDRGAILTALRAISRISMNLEQSNLLRGVKVSTLTKIFDWILLEDEELVSACLDFLYQFTAVPDNVALLLSKASDLSLPSFLGQLTRLLQNHAQESITKKLVLPAIPSTPATAIPAVPTDLLEQFLRLAEPDRSNCWLKAVFEEDPESEITQIALWQAYQDRFNKYADLDHPSLPAAEFIKNVSTIFAGANAQVVNGPSSKFIIKGIRPRHVPLDLKERPYSRCLWQPRGQDRCGQFFLKPKHMYDHISTSHLLIPRTSEGKWEFSAVLPTPDLLDCHWAGCLHFSRFAPGTKPSPFEVGMHVKTHLPDVSRKAALRAKHNRTPATATMIPGQARTMRLDPEHGREASYTYQVWHNTAVDERGEAAGLPLTSVLVLRNLARNIPKAEGLVMNGVAGGVGEDREGTMEKLFGPLRQRLLFVMAHNRPLVGFVADLMGWVEKGMREQE